MYYINVSAQQVEDLRPAVDLFVQLWGEDLDKGAIYLYGMVDETSPVIPAMEFSSGSDQVTYGVVAIPLNSDTLYFLTGSGYSLKREDFVYVEDSEIRSANFGDSKSETVVTLASFTKLAISSSGTFMDRFLKLENPDSVSGHDRKTDHAERTESGTNEEHGGLVHEEPELPEEKRSSVEGSVVDVWADSNIEDWSVEELYKLLHKLNGQEADGEGDSFFLWSASTTEGYLIQIKGDPGAAAKLIGAKLGLDPEEVKGEGTTMTGRQLASAIEALLGGG
jgi:hypothetical protein